MNKTLIIYDNEGYIVLQMSGNYRVPVGIPYLEVEIPENKIITGINIETNEPILEDRPKTDSDLIKEKQEEMELAILELASLIGGN